MAQSGIEYTLPLPSLTSCSERRLVLAFRKPRDVSSSVTAYHLLIRLNLGNRHSSTLADYSFGILVSGTSTVRNV